MDEIGIDLSRAFPKPLTDDAVRASDVVITMGCGDACPFYPGKRYLDWELPDPAGKGVDDVRPIREEIERHVLTLLQELSSWARPIRRHPRARDARRRRRSGAGRLPGGARRRRRRLRDGRSPWETFAAAKLPGHRHVAVDPATGEVLGWVAVSAVSDRCVYAGVVEHSVYVSPAHRGAASGPCS